MFSFMHVLLCMHALMRAFACAFMRAYVLSCVHALVRGFVRVIVILRARV